MKIYVVILLVLIFTASAYANGKTTADLKVGRVRAAGSSTPTIAEKLARKIDYSAKRKSAASILTDLTQLTGVTLKCGWNNKDWQVRDRKMTIYAKDVSLSDLMNSIASVMKFKWTKGGEDDNTYYKLYMDRKTLLGIERQRLLAEEAVKKCQSDNREDLLDAYQKLSQMTEQEIENLKEVDPKLYSVSTGTFSSVLAPLLSEVPDAREAWRLGQEIRLNAAALPTNTQEGILKMIADANEMRAQMALKRPDLNIKIAPESPDLTQMSIVIEPNNSHSARSAGLRMEIRWPNPDSSLGTGWSNFAGAADSHISSEWRNLSSGNNSTNQANSTAPSSREGSVSQAASKPPDFGEPLIEHPEDPELLCKVKLDVESTALDSIIESLARASEFSIVSDCLGMRSKRLMPPTGKAELRMLLDSIASQCRYNWDKHGSILEFRDRDWFRRRAEQIPDEWLEKWKKTLRETGTLDIDSLAQITRLTLEQFDANINEDEVLGKLDLSTIFWHHRHLIELYSSLDKEQLRTLLSDSGLDLASLDQPQMSIVKDVLKYNSEFLVNEQARVKIYGNRKRQDNQFEYTFTAVTSDELPPIVWKFTTPKYTPPKEEPKSEPGSQNQKPAES